MQKRGKGGRGVHRTSTCTASRSKPQTSRRRCHCKRLDTISSHPHRHGERAPNAHHDDLEEEDDKDAREGEARAEEEHQEEQRSHDDPVDVLRVPGPTGTCQQSVVVRSLADETTEGLTLP
jgi:hypothetical protein